MQRCIEPSILIGRKHYQARKKEFKGLELILFNFSKSFLTGVNDEEEPPVPIPNTEVKLLSAEDTWLVTTWENRSVPVQ